MSSVILYTTGTVEGIPLGIPVSIPFEAGSDPIPSHAVIENGWSSEIPGFDSYEDGDALIPCEEDDQGAMPYVDAYYKFYVHA